MKLKLAQLAERINAVLIGDGSLDIEAVGPIETARENEVTFITNNKHLAAIGKSRAGAVIVNKQIEGVTKPQLIVKDVQVSLIESLKCFAPKLKDTVEGIDPTAKVSQYAKIGTGVYIGPYVVIEEGVEIETNSVISSGCKIGENSKLGENCRLDSNVVIYHNCRLGKNVIIQANSTIGSTGFGYFCIDGTHKLIPHNGGVIIEDFVEIGANCCIDRAKFGNTIIGAGTKIDNLVQIAHNVVIGKCCLIAGQVGIAGSSKLGDGVVLAGQVGITDNIEIGKGTMVGAQAGVIHDTAAEQQIVGSPATEHKEAIKILTLTKRLPKLIEQLKQLSARIKELEAAKDDKA